MKYVSVGQKFIRDFKAQKRAVDTQRKFFHHDGNSIHRQFEKSIIMSKNQSKFVPPHIIRTEFVAKLSYMYEKEVPLYGTLLEHAERINQEATGRKSVSRHDMVTEHHGAIRVGTPEEMFGISRLFRVMKMRPVNYYNLTVANLPVHSTAFRPVTEEEFSHNGFRVFVSLLRQDLIPDHLRPQVQEILSHRKIFTDELLQIITLSEEQGGLTEEQAQTFLKEALKTFERHKHATVPFSTYKELLAVNSLLADIASFETPHINHLTPEVKSKKSSRGLVEGEAGIDRLQRELNEVGIATIPVVQGPPKRKVPILLRQGSFVALEEQFLFPDGKGGFEPGIHRARFGEYETKGDAAVTPKGRELYDRLLESVLSQTNDKKPNYMEVLTREFKAFPDDLETLRKQGLIYIKYRPTEEGLAQKGKLSDMSMDELIEKGFVTYDWVPYEDFLPVSAAGIFKSNLKEGGMVETMRTEDRKEDLEKALGQPILDSFALYAAEEARSELKTLTELGVTIPKVKLETLRRTIEADPARLVENTSCLHK